MCKVHFKIQLRLFQAFCGYLGCFLALFAFIFGSNFFHVTECIERLTYLAFFDSLESEVFAPQLA